MTKIEPNIRDYYREYFSIEGFFMLLRLLSFQVMIYLIVGLLALILTGIYMPLFINLLEDMYSSFSSAIAERSLKDCTPLVGSISDLDFMFICSNYYYSG
uniref:Uncharacterized protein n=1 Tax=Euplotes crassus TaxID=5936 RepID=A0A7S3NMX4_EUPCR